jgi:hypothetical protein
VCELGRLHITKLKTSCGKLVFFTIQHFHNSLIFGG